MQFLAIVTLLYGVSVPAIAEDISVPGGEFRLVELSNLMGEVSLSIIGLDDSSESYSPSTVLVFFGENDVPRYRFGIMKLEGQQGLTAFSDLAGPRLIEAKLSENEEYLLSYEYVGKGRLAIEFSGKAYTLDIGFQPVRVGHMVSGMHIRARYEP